MINGNPANCQASRVVLVCDQIRISISLTGDCEIILESIHPERHKVAPVPTERPKTAEEESDLTKSSGRYFTGRYGDD